MTKLVCSTTGCQRSHQGESKCLGQNRHVILWLQQLHPGLHVYDSHKCCSIRLHILLVKTMKIFYSIKTVYTNDSSSAHFIDTYTQIILYRDMTVLMADQALLDRKALRCVETSDGIDLHASCCCQEPHSQTRSEGQGMCVAGLIPRLGVGLRLEVIPLELGQYMYHYGGM